MPVAMFLLFGAMAEQSDRSRPSKMLQEAQGEFLAVIANGAVSPVDRSRLEQFLAISPAELLPGNLFRQERPQQRLARADIRHPDVVSVLWQSATAKACGQHAQAIAGAGGRVN